MDAAPLTTLRLQGLRPGSGTDLALNLPAPATALDDRGRRFERALEGAQADQRRADRHDRDTPVDTRADQRRADQRRADDQADQRRTEQRHHEERADAARRRDRDDVDRTEAADDDQPRTERTEPDEPPATDEESTTDDATDGEATADGHEAGTGEDQPGPVVGDRGAVAGAAPVAADETTGAVDHGQSNTGTDTGNGEGDVPADDAVETAAADELPSGSAAAAAAITTDQRVTATTAAASDDDHTTTEQTSPEVGRPIDDARSDADAGPDEIGGTVLDGTLVGGDGEPTDGSEAGADGGEERSTARGTAPGSAPGAGSTPNDVPVATASTVAPTGAEAVRVPTSEPNRPAVAPPATATNPAAPTVAIGDLALDTGAASRVNGSQAPESPEGADGDALWRQVRRALGSLRTSPAGDRQFTVRLQPADLGSVTVRITTGEHGVTVALLTESSAASNQLNQQRHLLVSDLDRSGLEGVTVDIGTHDDGRGQAERGEDGDRSEPGRSGFATAPASGIPIDGPESGTGPRRGARSTSTLLDVTL